MKPEAAIRQERLDLTAADGGVFFEGDQQLVFGGKPEDEVAVDRLDEAHVGHRRVELLADLQRGAEHAAEGEQGAALAGAADFTLADR